MTQETEHTEFEKEAKKYGLDSRRAAGAYYDSQTMTAFCLWQTARARGGRGEVEGCMSEPSEVDSIISIWSMRPKPNTPIGQAWVDGCRQGYEWGKREAQAKPVEASDD